MNSSLFAVCCIVACGLFSLGIDGRYIKRNAESETNLCSRSTPCGWDVYSPHQRLVVQHVESPCKCPNDSVCAKTSDDISISAYVYRCVPEGVEANEWDYDSVEKRR